MKNNPYLDDSKLYLSATKNYKAQRVPLGEVTQFNNMRASTAGKILRNSRMCKQKIDINIDFQLKQQTVQQKQISKRDKLHAMELRRCDLLRELEMLDQNIKRLKASQQLIEPKEIQKKKDANMEIKDEKQQKDLNVKGIFYQTTTIKQKQIDKKSLQQPPFTFRDKARLFDTFLKQISLQAELRTWKAKLPKQFQSDVFKILEEKHKIPIKDLKIEMDEFDPFVQPDSSISKQTFVNNIYLNHSKCSEFWKNHATNKFEKEQIKTLFGKLDFDKQGTVSIKQLVREMSILLDKNLRTRDLFRVFRKITEQGDQFTCTQLLKALARKQRNHV